MELGRKEATDSDYELWTLVLDARDIIFDIRERELAKYGITVRQVGILSIVNALGGNAKLAEIARVSNREANSISTIVQRMEKNGLIKKKRDLQKKNVIRVSLTEKGQEILPLANNRRSLHRIFASLSEAEIVQMKLCLNKLISKALQELNK